MEGREGEGARDKVTKKRRGNEGVEWEREPFAREGAVLGYLCTPPSS